MQNSDGIIGVEEHKPCKRKRININTGEAKEATQIPDA